MNESNTNVDVSGTRREMVGYGCVRRIFDIAQELYPLACTENAGDPQEHEHLKEVYNGIRLACVALADYDPSLAVDLPGRTPLSKVKQDRVDAMVNSLSYRYIQVDDTNTTICIAELPDGFEIGMGKSSCLSSTDFNAAIGEQISRENAMADAVNKLWFAEGYAKFMGYTA